MPIQEPNRTIGIDFSGAVRAGRKIWISAGSVVDGALHLDTCFRATALTGGSADRHVVLPAMRAWIAAFPDATVGCDFPFSLRADLVEAETWRSFALGFGRRYPDPVAFRDACRSAAGDREAKRVTDVAAQAPFSPYNLRVFRQTFYGIRDFLAPLLAEERVVVVPMMSPVAGKATLLEACPASALKRLGLYRAYKGREMRHQHARGALLDELSYREDLVVADPALRDLILLDGEGDALDSALAAVVAFWATLDPERLETLDPVTRIEGRIYT